MRVKKQWQQDSFIRAAKAQSGSPTMCIQLPVAMADLKKHPGADRTILASVYAMDGKAVVVPATRRCGILVVEWSKLMRYLRRRNNGKAWDANKAGRYEVYSTEEYRNFPSVVPAGRYEHLEDAKKHADSVTYKMAVIDSKAESRGFIYCNWESAPTDSPWGRVQHARRREDGIWFVSTASHGGYRLSEQRQAELHEVEVFKPFGPQWLEEDCEAALIALRWPGYATDEQIADAISMVKAVASWSHSSARWKPVADWIETTMLHERAERHHEAVKHLWQRGSMSTQGNGWSVSFRRGDERRDVVMKDYPAKRYYNDSELDALHVTLSDQLRKAGFPRMASNLELVGNSYDFEPSDADPGL